MGPPVGTLVLSGCDADHSILGTLVLRRHLGTLVLRYSGRIVCSWLHAFWGRCMLSGHLGALTRVMGRDARTPTGDRTYGLVGVHRLIRVPGTWGCRPTHNMLLCMLAARLVACAHAAVWVCDVAW